MATLEEDLKKLDEEKERRIREFREYEKKNASVSVIIGVIIGLAAGGAGYYFSKSWIVAIIAFIIFWSGITVYVGKIMDKRREKRISEEQRKIEYEIKQEREKRIQEAKMKEAEEALHKPINTSSSGTKDIAKGAAAGWIIGGPAGGVIGAIVGKDKADQKRANSK